MKTYFDGFRDALKLYAWWEDGVQYVDTAGTTLKDALKDTAIEETYFYEKQTILLKERLEELENF